MAGRGTGPTCGREDLTSYSQATKTEEFNNTEAHSAAIAQLDLLGGALTRFTKYGDACCRCNEPRPLSSSAKSGFAIWPVPTLALKFKLALVLSGNRSE
ncbi:protein of unknown function (plasmid) [Agrobacterium pusense]|uniref:Uncharacterized protein n=1 Tax=Agrobacterium pusense TaxID=648995 RepID=U4QDL5_9HYPH|nr:protein of unknown function [Agrobacterium pusense]